MILLDLIEDTLTIFAVIIFTLLSITTYYTASKNEFNKSSCEKNMVTECYQQSKNNQEFDYCLHLRRYLFCESNRNKI